MAQLPLLHPAGIGGLGTVPEPSPLPPNLNSPVSLLLSVFADSPAEKGGELLNNQLWGWEMGRPLFPAFADFHGVNIPYMVVSQPSV